MYKGNLLKGTCAMGGKKYIFQASARSGIPVKSGMLVETQAVRYLFCSRSSVNSHGGKSILLLDLVTFLAGAAHKNITFTARNT